MKNIVAIAFLMLSCQSAMAQEDTVPLTCSQKYRIYAQTKEAKDPGKFHGKKARIIYGVLLGIAAGELLGESHSLKEHVKTDIFPAVALGTIYGITGDEKLKASEANRLADILNTLETGGNSAQLEDFISKIESSSKTFVERYGKGRALSRDEVIQGLLTGYQSGRFCHRILMAEIQIAYAVWEDVNNF